MLHEHHDDVTNRRSTLTGKRAEISQGAHTKVHKPWVRQRQPFSGADPKKLGLQQRILSFCACGNRPQVRLLGKFLPRCLKPPFLSFSATYPPTYPPVLALLGYPC